MKHCPNPECPSFVRLGQAAEFGDAAERCSDCGAELSAGDIRTAAGAAFASGATSLEPNTKRALLVSSVVTAAVFLLGMTPLPLVEHEVAGGPAGLLGLFNIASTLRLSELGLMGCVTGFFVVEVAALAVPAWRPIRVDPRRRPQLVKAGLVVGGLLTILHAVMETRVWQGMSDAFSYEFGYALFPTSGHALAAGVIVGAISLALMGLTQVVDRFGLGSGFSVVSVGLLVPVVIDHWASNALAFEVLGLRQLGIELGLVAVFAGAAFRLVEDPEPGPRLPRPAAGLVAASFASGLLLLPSTLATLFDVGLNLRWHWYVTLAVDLVVITVGTWAVVRLLYRPAVVAPGWSAFGGTEATAQATAELRDALLPAILFGGLLVGAEHVGGALHAVAMPAVVVVLVCAGRDLAEELRFRRAHGDVEVCLQVPQLHLVGPALALLDGLGIAAIAQGARHRTLYHWFAPHLAVRILVPDGDGPRAKAALLEKWPV